MVIFTVLSVVPMWFYDMSGVTYVIWKYQLVPESGQGESMDEVTFDILITSSDWIISHIPNLDKHIDLTELTYPW